MLRDSDLAELSSSYNKETGRINFDRSSLERWRASTGQTKEALVDDVMIYIARGFHEGRLSFEFCDAVANHIFGHTISTLTLYCKLSALGWDVFHAFDEGEFYHDGKRDEEPVEVYTRPKIARIIEKLA